MNKFLEIYNNIINDDTLCPEYIGRNIFNIMNEWVESPNLVQFPKELQIELCKNLRKHFDNLYIISYKKIIEILEKYDYDYVDDVINGMKKYDVVNKGYLILICVKLDESDNLLSNKTLKFIKENFNDIYDNAYHIFSNIYNNRYADGLTVLHRDNYDPEDAYTCIYINRDCSNMKDTLEHELCHFIKRVANYQNKFPKTYSGLTVDKLRDRRLKCVDYIYNIFNSLGFSKEVCYALKELVLRTCTEDEEQNSINSIVNGIIRKYETDKTKFKINHLNKSIPQIEHLLSNKQLIEFRLSWLNNFLSGVNSYKFFKDNKNIIESYFSTRNYFKNYDIEFILKCVSYLCFKFNYPEYDIDKILTYNFKKFKFRDV